MKSIKFNGIEFEVIEDFPNYAISKCGKVLSLNYNKTKKFAIMKIQSNKNGYLALILSNKGVLKRMYLHRLLAIQFIPNPENKPQVNHKNRLKTDNRLLNLEWVNQSENEIHKHESTKEYKIKLIKQYDLEGNFIRNWTNFIEINEKLDIKIDLLKRCCKNKQKTAGEYIWKYG